MPTLTSREAKSLIERVGPKLGYDYTDSPVFPEGRDDVCAVKHTAENGSTYGYDVIYVVWKSPDGEIHYEEIKNSRATKDYIHIQSVKVKGDGSVSVDFGSGGSFSGVPWDESMKISIQQEKADVSANEPESFEVEARQAMVKVIENHLHPHPLYKQTVVKQSVIDEKRKMAIFILFEQIDTDRVSEHGEGWLGDQFRYSLWVKNNSNDPIQIYEDHAYIRPHTKSGHTGTRGRDCTLKDLKLEGNTIKVMHPEGEKYEEQEWKEMSFNL